MLKSKLVISNTFKEPLDEQSFFSNNFNVSFDPIILFFNNMNCVELPFLCSVHMFGEKKFFTEKMLKGIKQYLPEINSFLFPVFRSNFFVANSHSQDSKQAIICNFGKKRYCYFSKKETKLPNALIIDVDRSTKDYLIAIRIYENRRLFAGRFDSNGNLQGDGVHINKKGNVFLGKFVDNDLSDAFIYQSNGIIYKGKLKDFKKSGDNEIEIKPDTYQFQGVFNNNKRIKGTLTLYNNPLVSSVTLQKYSKEILKNYLAKIVFKHDGGEVVYEGEVKERKLNSENVVIKKIKHDNSLEYTYKGNIVKNKREGVAIYEWKEKEYFKGSFIDNNPHSLIYPKDDDPDNMSVFYSGERKFCVLFKRGELVDLIPVNDNLKEFEENKSN